MEDPSKSRARSPRRTDRSPSVTSGSVSNSAAAACPVSCTTRPFPIPNRLKPAIINCLLHYCLARGFLLSQCCCPAFQRKHYLWGVFKPREDKGGVAEPLSAIGRFAHEVEKEKQQHVLDQQDEMILKMSTMNHLPAKDTQVEASHVKGPPNMGFDLKAPNEGTQAEAEAAPVATDAAASPANHGQIDPTCMGLPVGRLMGFVMRQTPKLEQLIQEMKREGVYWYLLWREVVWVPDLGQATWILPCRSWGSEHEFRAPWNLTSTSVPCRHEQKDA
ncbi:hypothetical protein GQ55_3G036300 [Panicum hallii var. hallii]|uniref:Uncharacterized protein n=1 Tax=Panicum hallii var. hallii TaxID=1504633 RepID=A0A2T7E5E1_9POAL|nr:hypothetical protein GQ55_3G036300 [Panicum hallii var. hallii]